MWPDPLTLEFTPLRHLSRGKNLNVGESGGRDKIAVRSVLQDRYISVRKGQQQKATKHKFSKKVTSDFEKEFISVELV